MQTAEHRSDDNRLAQVLMTNARRDALPDPLMGSSLIEVDPVLANQRIQVPVAEQKDVVEQLPPGTSHKSFRGGIHVGRSHGYLDALRRVGKGQMVANRMCRGAPAQEAAGAPHQFNQPLGSYQRANEADDWLPLVVWMQ